MTIRIENLGAKYTLVIPGVIPDDPHPALDWLFRLLSGARQKG